MIVTAWLGLRRIGNLRSRYTILRVSPAQASKNRSSECCACIWPAEKKIVRNDSRAAMRTGSGSSVLLLEFEVPGSCEPTCASEESPASMSDFVFSLRVPKNEDKDPNPKRLELCAVEIPNCHLASLTISSRGFRFLDTVLWSMTCVTGRRSLCSAFVRS